MNRITFCLLLLAWTSQASATFFDISGEITTCDDFACNLATIQVGDLLSGYIEVDDAASGPNSTFVETDIISARLLVGSLDSGVLSGPFDPVALTTDANGEIVSGNALFTTIVDAGIFGQADVEIALNAAAGTWTASTDLLGLGEVASGVIFFARRVDTDSDGDGISDNLDNCTGLMNANQRDTDGDGIGNTCDPDVAAPNDCSVNFLDLNVYKVNFFQTGDLDTDNNGDGQTNFLDLNVISDYFFAAPGPSASGCN